MKVGKAGLALVEEFEGFSSKWYPDPAVGWKVPTVCFGHTDAAGDPKYKETKTKVFTKEEGREILRRDMQKYADAVAKAVKVTLTDNQFDALVSWCYNVGPGAMAGSTLVRKLNAGDYAAVPSELAKWDKAGGKTLKGLTRRRAAEAALFTSKSAAVPTPTPRPTPAASPATKPSGLGVAVVAGIGAVGAALVGWWDSIAAFFSGVFQ